MVYFYGFDVETIGEKREYGLQPYRVPKGEASISSFALVDETGLVVDRGLNPTRAQLRAALELIAADPHAVVVGWNTVFDVSWLIAYEMEDLVRRINWFDGQIIRRGLENVAEDYNHGGAWGLKATVAKYLPEYAGYEEDVAGNFERVDETLLQYNTLDSQLTARLARIMWDQLDPEPARLVQVVCQSIPAFARAWLDGVAFSREALDEWADYCAKEMTAGESESGIDAKTIMSPKKLLAELRRRGHDVNSTDKSVLSAIDDPEIQAARRYKKAHTALSRYINKTHACLDYHGGITVHSSPYMWSTYTGRCTYRSKQKEKARGKGKGMGAREIQVGVALHQWPKKNAGKIARRCIVAPPGMLLAEYDFSNQESRVLADYSQDPTLQKVFNDGLDFHSTMGAKAARMPYEEFYHWYKSGDQDADRFRQMGKVANLSLAYRTGPETFQTMARTDYDVHISMDESIMLCQLFKTTYPGVVHYWYDAISRAKFKGYAETRGGRRVLLNKWIRGQGGYASEQTALNFPIQGTGADMKFLGIALVDAYCQTRGARYNYDLHDALFVLIPDDERAMETARTIKHILNTLPYEEVFNWTPSVPMPVDGKIGKSWGDLKEIE